MNEHQILFQVLKEVIAFFQFKSTDFNLLFCLVFLSKKT